MNEELAKESNGLYLTGEYTLEQLAQKYEVTVGKIRYSWRKYNLSTKLTKEAKSKSAKNGAAKRDIEKSNKKREETVLDRYGVSNVSKAKDIQEKKEQTMLNKYGVKNCNQVQLKNLDIINSKESLERWSDDFYKHNGKKPTRRDLSCVVGWSFDDPASKIIHQYKLENKFLWGSSYLERNFEDIVRKWGINYEIHNRTVIAPFEIDFWFPEFRIGIEINDVASHNSDMPFMEGGVPKPSNYHQEKAKKAIDANVRLLHLYEWELYDDKVMSFVKELFNMDNQTIPARKTKLKEISKRTANYFLDKYHLQGKCSGNDINIGLFYNDDLVSVMTFGRPRHSNDYEWELLRYCSSCRVTGGASKMFNFFMLKCNEGDRILSFQDMDKFSGNLYDKLGFEYEGYTKPSYTWVKRDNIFDRYSWYVILHKGVDNVLGTSYGKGENNINLMKKEGYVRVYNSGMRKYVYIV